MKVGHRTSSTSLPSMSDAQQRKIAKPEGVSNSTDIISCNQGSSSANKSRTNLIKHDYEKNIEYRYTDIKGEASPRPLQQGTPNFVNPSLDWWTILPNHEPFYKPSSISGADLRPSSLLLSSRSCARRLAVI
jgi:hypothetical protein